jgi:hypothetical protein
LAEAWHPDPTKPSDPGKLFKQLAGAPPERRARFDALFRDALSKLDEGERLAGQIRALATGDSATERPGA